MAWTSPRTYVAGEVITAAIFNDHIRSNLRYLKGLDGSVTIDNDLTVSNLLTAGNVDGVDVSAHASGTAMAGHTAGAGTHSHSASAADGGLISASVITGRYGLDNLPVGTDGYYLKGKGAGSPSFEPLAVTAVSAINATTSTISVSTDIVGHSFLVPSTAKNVYAMAYMYNGAGAGGTSGDARISFKYNGSTEATASGVIGLSLRLDLSGKYPGKGIAASFDFVYNVPTQVNTFKGVDFLFYEYLS